MRHAKLHTEQWTILAIVVQLLSCKPGGAAGAPVAGDWPAARAVCQPVPLTSVEVQGFLGRRIDFNRAPLLEAMESALPRGFAARAAGKDLPPEADRLAADSDLYKWLEGACYFYARTRDADMRKHIDRIAGLIVQCQHRDGYLNTQVPPRRRFDSEVNHDLYIAGHFFEAAVAHGRATGEQTLLQAACRWSDYLIAEYQKGHPYYQTVGAREHSEYELGLLRLARATGRKDYLDFAITLARMNRVGPTVADIRAGGGLHAVRVGYLLAGLADLYLETGREDLHRYLPELWEELVETRMYVTGAIGSHGEQISKNPHDLPHWRDHRDRQLGETCACIALMMFTWRMHALTGQSRCFDLIERILYNHLLGAISLDHLGHFYYNPMRAIGDLSGFTDHGQRPCTARCRLPQLNRTTCCMPNVMRLFGAMPEYLFAVDSDGVFVNLYTSAKVNATLPDGRTIQFTVLTDYPHHGRVELRFTGTETVRGKVRLRIPDWCQLAGIEVSGEPSVAVGGGDYYLIDRRWQPGDAVTLTLAMPVRMLMPHPRVAANASQVVFARGPLLYCLENEDVDFPVEQARVSLHPHEAPARVSAEWHAGLLDGIHVLRVPGTVCSPEHPVKLVTLPLIPWYARANRSADSRWLLFLPWTRHR